MFQADAGQWEKLSNWDELSAWTAEENNSISYIPSRDILKNNAIFIEDKYLKSSNYNLEFTEVGLRDLCYKFRLYPDVLKTMAEEGLASKVLNDLLKSDHVQKRLSKSEFVIDRRQSNGSDGKVCGIVSKNYVRYNNHSFIQDIRSIISQKDTPSSEYLSFREAHSNNTRLFLRLTSTHISGVIDSADGKSEDITQVGLEFRNGMVGDTAVSINFFLYRLACANGLILPTGRHIEKIIHWGKVSNFLSLLDNAFSSAASELHEKKRYVEELSGIEFLPERLAELNLVKMITDIIPKSKSTITKRFRNTFNEFSFKKLNEDEKLKRDTLILKYLPEVYAKRQSASVFNSPFRSNASMFDFINMFTEHANMKPIGEQIGIQERAGDFAEWIVSNKALF